MCCFGIRLECMGTVRVLDQSLNIGTLRRAFGIWFVNVLVDYLDSESERRVTVRGPPGLYWYLVLGTWCLS